MKKFLLFFVLTIILNPLFSFGTIPSGFFVKNHGQWNPNIKYAAFNNNYAFGIFNTGFFFDYYKVNRNEEGYTKSGEVVHLKIENGNFDQIIEEGNSDWYLNFFYSNEPSRWAKHIRGVKKICIKNVLPMIDLTLMHSEKQYIRYDFTIHPGGKPEQILLKIEGVKFEIPNPTTLKLNTSFGVVTHTNLFVFQNINGKKIKVPATFKRIDSTTFSFYIEKYNRNYDLIIDPIVFSSIIGGNNPEEIVDIKEPMPGKIIVTGWTESFDFPTTPGTYNRSYSGEKDIFISSFDISGSKRKLIFSTFLGSSGNDYPATILLDNKNNIIIGGTTNSPDLPLVNSLTQSFYGQYDAYVCKFTPSCDSIILSTYIGGSKDDFATAFQISPDNSIYITGYTNSPNLPTTGGAYQSNLKGKNDIFFIKLSSSAQQILTCTYLGGSEDDFAYCMAITPSEYIYIGGATKSGDFPVFPVRIWGSPPYEYVMESPYDRSYNGNFDGVVIKIFGKGGGLEYSTFFGGLADDYVTAISYFGPDEKVVFAGKTYKEPSTITFPLTQTAFQNTIKGLSEAFVASLSNIEVKSQYGYNYKSQNLIFSTFLGGSQDDVPTSIAFNKQIQNVIVVGYTNSTNFPIINNPAGKKFQKFDIFYASLVNDGSSVTFSDILGGNDDDIPYSFLLTSEGDYYIVGKTSSTNFPVVNNIEGLTAGTFPNSFILKNVGTTLRIDSPVGGEEYCPDSKIPVRIFSDGLQSSDTLCLEIMPEHSSEWQILDSNFVGFSKNISIPQNISGKVYLRVSHRRGIIACLKTPISILLPPKIIKTQPENHVVEICEGDSISFSVSAEGSKLTYQWFFNNKKIPNATDTFLILQNVTTENSGKYKVVASGFCPPSDTSEEFQLNIIPKTKIISHSGDTTVKVGEKLFLYVSSVGSNLKYQWYRDNSKLLGANNYYFSTEKVSKSDEGKYFCIVEGTCGKDTTSEITVKIDTTIINQVSEQEKTLNKPNLLIVHNQLLVDLNQADYEGSIEVAIFDFLGNEIENLQIPALFSVKIDLNISFLPSGLYLARIKLNNRIENILFLKL
jgi:hypothetical protein